jgi:hypothetical protein
MQRNIPLPSSECFPISVIPNSIPRLSSSSSNPPRLPHRPPGYSLPFPHPSPPAQTETKKNKREDRAKKKGGVCAFSLSFWSGDTNLGLDIVDSVGRLHLEGDGLTRQAIQEDNHEISVGLVSSVVPHPHPPRRRAIERERERRLTHVLTKICILM